MKSSVVKVEKIPENELPFIKRLLIYQKERFPFVAHGLMIAAFTFSAASYSMICRGREGFISVSDFLIGVFATFSLFFLVRIFDEFKDKEDDARFRAYLPVPRGLISLRELKIMGWVLAIIQVLVIAILQTKMILLYSLVLAYLLLMRVEFFIPKWLKSHQIAYITSHMFIIPLIDLYASGLDWLIGNSEPHWGLAWFFAVSYCNGLVLEFGRKLRTPEDEEPGVISYTGLYGTKGGVVIWIALLTLTMILAIGASHYAGYGLMAYIIFGAFFILCTIPGILFILNPKSRLSKLIEYSSALWTALMYLALGGIPMLNAILFG